MDILDQAGIVRVRQWLAEMKAGDDEAVKSLMGQYVNKLERLARRCLDGVPRGARDETDIAQSVFKSFVARARQGRFPQLDGPEHLWRILRIMARRKAARLREREKRVQRVCRKAAKPAVTSAEATPAEIAGSQDEQEFLLQSLPDEAQREAAALKFQRCTNEEIAVKLGITIRSAERLVAGFRKRLARLVKPR